MFDLDLHAKKSQLQFLQSRWNDLETLTNEKIKIVSEIKTVDWQSLL